MMRRTGCCQCRGPGRPPSRRPRPGPAPVPCFKEGRLGIFQKVRRRLDSEQQPSSKQWHCCAHDVAACTACACCHICGGHDHFSPRQGLNLQKVQLAVVVGVEPREQLCDDACTPRPRLRLKISPEDLFFRGSFRLLQHSKRAFLLSKEACRLTCVTVGHALFLVVPSVRLLRLQPQQLMSKTGVKLTTQKLDVASRRADTHDRTATRPPG